MGIITFQRYKSLEPKDNPKVTSELLMIASEYDKRHGTNKFDELLKHSAIELEKELDELNRRFNERTKEDGVKNIIEQHKEKE